MMGQMSQAIYPSSQILTIKAANKRRLLPSTLNPKEERTPTNNSHKLSIQAFKLGSCTYHLRECLNAFTLREDAQRLMLLKQ